MKEAKANELNCLENVDNITMTSIFWYASASASQQFPFFSQLQLRVHITTINRNQNQPPSATNASSTTFGVAVPAKILETRFHKTFSHLHNSPPSSRPQRLIVNEDEFILWRLAVKGGQAKMEWSWS